MRVFTEPVAGRWRGFVSFGLDDGVASSGQGHGNRRRLSDEPSERERHSRRHHWYVLQHQYTDKILMICSHLAKKISLQNILELHLSVAWSSLNVKECDFVWKLSKQNRISVRLFSLYKLFHTWRRAVHGQCGFKHINCIAYYTNDQEWSKDRENFVLH